MAEKKVVLLKNRCERIVARIRVTQELIASIHDDSKKKDTFLARCEKISEWLQEFEYVQKEIEEQLLELDKIKELQDLGAISNKVDEWYFDIMQTKNVIKNSENSIPKTTSNSMVRAPIIKLPTFDSDIKSWCAFHSLFKSLIHDSNAYTNVEKFHYLLSVITGPALGLIKSLPLIEENYDIAWNILVNQYQNSRMLFTHYVDEILNFKCVQTESASGIARILSNFQENYAAINAMKIENIFDKFVGHIIIRAMDPTTKRQFESKLPGEEIPGSESIFVFLRNQSRMLEMSSPHITKEKKGSYKTLLSANKDNIVHCPLCRGSHFLYKCASFTSLSPHQRREKIKNLNRCFNCLKQHHVKDCVSKFTCQVCSKKHHSMLHISVEPPAPGDNENNASTTLAAVLHNTPCITNNILLGTIQLDVRNKNNVYVPIRAVIDSGSQVSLITERCAKRLGLTIKANRIPLNGLGNCSVKSCYGSTKCFIKPKNKMGPVFQCQTIVITEITSHLPSYDLPSSVTSQFNNLKLADESYDKSGPIDVLLGADIYLDIFNSGHEIIRGFPCAVNSIFGYIIMGKVNNSSFQTPSSLFVGTNSLNNNLRQFWEIEETPSINLTTNPEDELAETIYSSNHYRENDGRYVVPLLTKSETMPEQNSFKLAESRLNKLEVRFKRDPILAINYGKFIKEYECLGHMKRVPRNLDAFYLPHHCVLNPDSKTTKLRVVFDGSAKTQPQNLSLNDLLLNGPKLQTEIPRMILNFRFHKYVFTADICKMYRQILIIPSQRKFQNILWRESQNEPVINFELQTITYGLSSSPYLAIRTLRQLAQDEGSKYPDAAKALCDDFYVDDLVTGTETISTALKLKQDIIALLNLGKLELSKWQSNTLSLLDQGSQEHQQDGHSFDNVGSDQIVKILGIQWSPMTDNFTYKVNTPRNEICTKRTILSTIARLFDPLGIITPVTFFAKCLLQELWKLRVEWDDREVPPHIHNTWSKFVTQLSLLRTLNIPRYYNTVSTSRLVLVGFCDASQLGYAGVVYLLERSNNTTHILMGKSKVAPLKTLSIPRLELCGAVLLTKLVKYIMSSVKFAQQIENVFLFTDSTIVLAWLKTPPYLLKTFVANRVVQILENTQNAIWKHVASEENCADSGSRGLFPADIISHPLWFTGPQWLRQPMAHWPCSAVSNQSIEEIPEIKTGDLKTFVSSQIVPNSIISKYSSFNKLKRVVAWIMRFVNNCRKLSGTGNINSTYLSSRELNDSLLKIVRIEQETYFSVDIRNMRNNVPCSTQILNLKPFLDSYGIIRVGGRLKYSDLSYENKFPILLPKISHLAYLIIDYYHNIYFHVGPRSLQFTIQRKFWIVAARNKIRSQLAKCIVCHKIKSSALPPPLMADLPPCRVQQSRVFSRVGIDFGGPFTLKDHKRRGAKTSKGYLCLFVCMATKAVHLETVSELSSEAFIAALSRFTDRRGLCAEIISDNGTNFVGTNRYLLGINKFLASQHDVISNHLTQSGIIWSFNPPASPHFGGLFEAGIKSVKYHLKRVIGETVLTYEEFATVLTRIEAILNSRPLCSMSSDPEDFNGLTPGHFLIGGFLLGLPEYDFLDTASNRLSRWQHLQKMSQHFWKRWHFEYLNTLQQRSKWCKINPNIKLGQLVLIKDDRLPPMKWVLGRITEVHPGKDGMVRVATVKTPTGSLVRPVIKLCPLPVE